MLVTPKQCANAIGLSVCQWRRIAKKEGIGCIYTLQPRPYYSMTGTRTRGSCRYQLKDVLALFDKIMGGDKSILNSVKHNLAKSATSIKGMTILNDEHHLLDDLLDKGSVD